MITPAASHSTARPPVTLFPFSAAWLSSDSGSRASLGGATISQTLTNPLKARNAIAGRSTRIIVTVSPVGLHGTIARIGHGVSALRHRKTVT